MDLELVWLVTCYIAQLLLIRIRLNLKILESAHEILMRSIFLNGLIITPHR